jgi:Flp pilus assembly protein TadB
MSKDRARRRAEREVLADAARQVRARQVARRARWRSVLAALRRPVQALQALRPRRRPDSALRRQRKRQNGGLAAALLALNGVLWLFEPSWLLRWSVVVGSVLAWPLLVVVIFDRGRSA